MKESFKTPHVTKGKSDGMVKAHGCAYGWPQREYTTKEEVSSPTVSLDYHVP